MDKREMLLHSLDGLHLLDKAEKADVVGDLLGLQAQFARNPEISLMLRATDYDAGTWQDGLVKVWTHRGTIHVIREAELGLFLSAVGCVGAFTDSWNGLTVKDQETWYPFIQNEIAKGNDTRDGLKAACERAGMGEELMGRVFYGWGGLIKEMALRGLLAGAPGMEKRYLVPKNVAFMERDEARRVLIQRYCASFGPATVEDCAFFFGYVHKPMRDLIRQVVKDMPSVVVDGKIYYYNRVLSENLRLPECVLLPGFDQLVMGYRDRSRFLDEKHAKKLTNVAGIVFPAVILRGKVRAKWKWDEKCATITPFEPLSEHAREVIARTFMRKLKKEVRFAEE